MKFVESLNSWISKTQKLWFEQDMQFPIDQWLNKGLNGLIDFIDSWSRQGNKGSIKTFIDQIQRLYDSKERMENNEDRMFIAVVGMMFLCMALKPELEKHHMERLLDIQKRIS